jgi:hypothetical protein
MDLVSSLTAIKTLLGLIDTPVPGSYSGQAGRPLVVNLTENALEFDLSPVFYVHKDGNPQPDIVSGVWTKMLWSGVGFDSHGNFASDKFTPITPVPRFYVLLATLYCLGTLVDQATIQLRIYKNGGVFKHIVQPINGTGSQSVSIAAIIDANGFSDNFEIYFYHTTGTNEIIEGSTLRTFFMGARIG